MRFLVANQRGQSVTGIILGLIILCIVISGSPPPDSILCCGINVWGVEAININESRCHIVIIKLEGTRIKQISALQGDRGHYYSVSRAHHHIQYFIISVITGARSRHYREYLHRYYLR